MRPDSTRNSTTIAYQEIAVYGAVRDLRLWLMDAVVLRVWRLTTQRMHDALRAPLRQTNRVANTLGGCSGRVGVRRTLAHCERLVYSGQVLAEKVGSSLRDDQTSRFRMKCTPAAAVVAFACLVDAFVLLSLTAFRCR